MSIKSSNINSQGSGFTISRLNTDVYLSGFRAEYKFPEYLDPEHYSYVTRYENIRRIQDNSNIFHETFNNYKIPESDSDQYITVNIATENRLDVIACRYYKSPIMWWVIALANDIIDPLGEIPAGTVLRIPSLTSVYETNIL